MIYIYVYHASNICLIRHDLKIYDIHTLSMCINCLHKWKFEMWKKLLDLNYLIHHILPGHWHHMILKKRNINSTRKKNPNSVNNDLTNKNWLPNTSLSWYRNILEQESALNENTLKMKTTHKYPSTITKRPKHYAFYLQSNTMLNGKRHYNLFCFMELFFYMALVSILLKDIFDNIS